MKPTFGCLVVDGALVQRGSQLIKDVDLTEITGQLGNLGTVALDCHDRPE